MSDIQEEMKRQYKKAEENDKKINNQDELNNLIDMMKEFDYKKNGKEKTLEFLLIMYQYFNEIDF